jgi:hypothetical protein
MIYVSFLFLVLFPPLFYEKVLVAPIPFPSPKLMQAWVEHVNPLAWQLNT